LPAPRPASIPSATKLAAVKQPSPARAPIRDPQSQAASHEPSSGSKPQPENATAFLDNLTSAVDSGNLFAQRQLTTADMMDYAKRNYRNARAAGLLATASEE
jgi:predicted lipid-binding transport protein (Tim44 family)